MEQDLATHIRDYFGAESIDIRNYSPLALAYIGDGIFDIVIRTLVVSSGNIQVSKMHSHTSHIVKAASQAAIAENILDILTDDELATYKRGRNAKSHTAAKNANVMDYRKATGFEALIGYLYLAGDMDRAMELIKIGMERTFGTELSEINL